MFRIGRYEIDRPFLLAPMASVSEMPFRVMALEMGAGLATTELISASGIFYKNRRTRQYMTFDRERERPYSMQLFGGAIDVMAHAAEQAALHGADIVDINMGCPVRKVTTTGSGSALLCDIPRAADMVRRMREAVGDRVPITAKIRLGWDDKDKHTTALEMAKQLEGAGCAALAIHGRTRAQGYSGRADWDAIAAVKGAVKMPIIGNGDIATPADARRLMEQSGCDAVMIGRGALGNPWIFSALKSGRDEDATPSPAARLALIRRHLRDHIAFHESLDTAPEATDDVRQNGRPAKPRAVQFHTPPSHMAVRTFRQHLVWYSRGLRGGKDFRKAVLTIEEPALVIEAVEKFFGAADADTSTNGADGATEDAEGVNYAQAFG